MWIHVPSILSACVRDMRASDLGSEKLYELESSAMWKSNFQQLKSWQNVWRKRPSMRLLSGLTSKPSTLSRGVEKWICSLEDFRASHLVLRARENRKTTSETSGLMSDNSLMALGFQSSFLKMCQESSDTTGIPYDPNFERWVTKLRRDSSQRQVLGLLTRGNDSSFWPTAQNKDYKRENLPAWEARQQRKAEEGINLQQNLCIATLKNWPTPGANEDRADNYTVETSQKHLEEDRQVHLAQVVKMNWPTPRVFSANGPSETELEDGNPKRRLETEAAKWPTPNTMDALAPKSQEALDYEHDTARQGRSNPNNLRDQAAVQEGVTNWPTVTTQEIPHEDMELTDTGRRKAKNGEGSHGLNLQDTAANWPTPMASDENDRQQTETWQGEHDLPSVVKNWPTPNTRDTRRGCNQKQLATEADKWPTPAARDYKGFDGPNKKNPVKPQALYLSTHQDLETGTDGTGSSDNTPTSHQPTAKKDTMCSPKCRRLNPAMAEHLMGLCPGWTSVSEPLETELYQQWRQSLLELLQEN